MRALISFKLKYPDKVESVSNESAKQQKPNMKNPKLSVRKFAYKNRKVDIQREYGVFHIYIDGKWLGENVATDKVEPQEALARMAIDCDSEGVM